MIKRVTILFEDDSADAPTAALDRVAAGSGEYDAIDTITDACRRNGWKTSHVIATRDARAVLDAIDGADVVFNLVESVEGDAQLETAVAWLLEMSGVPYTGAPPAALWLALNKPLARAWLAACGVPVPWGYTLEHWDDPIDGAVYPAIVKPAREDASLGIDATSIVADETQARARIRRLIETLQQPALLEEYVEGREFAVALIGDTDRPTVLPVREIDFAGMPDGHPRILTFESKWLPADPAYKGTRGLFPDDLTSEQIADISDVAVAAWRAGGLRDYGRIDLRVAPGGRPMVIDINANPDLSMTAGFLPTAAHAGIGCDDLIRRIVEGAFARGAR